MLMSWRLLDPLAQVWVIVDSDSCLPLFGDGTKQVTITKLLIVKSPGGMTYYPLTYGPPALKVR
jgi:hypothetical protein